MFTIEPSPPLMNPRKEVYVLHRHDNRSPPANRFSNFEDRKYHGDSTEKRHQASRCCGEEVYQERYNSDGQTVSHEASTLKRDEDHAATPHHSFPPNERQAIPRNLPTTRKKIRNDHAPSSNRSSRQTLRAPT